MNFYTLVQLTYVVREGRPRQTLSNRGSFSRRNTESLAFLVRLILTVPKGFPILDRLVHEQTAIARIKRNSNQTNTTHFFI